MRAFSRRSVSSSSFLLLFGVQEEEEEDVDDEPSRFPCPEKEFVLLLLLLLAARVPGLTKKPDDDEVDAFGSPTGAFSTICRGKRHEQQTPKSANRFT